MIPDTEGRDEVKTAHNEFKNIMQSNSKLNTSKDFIL
jgi:hypothetical protein